MGLKPAERGVWVSDGNGYVYVCVFVWLPACSLYIYVCFGGPWWHKLSGSVHTTVVETEIYLYSFRNIYFHQTIPQRLMMIVGWMNFQQHQHHHHTIHIHRWDPLFCYHFIAENVMCTLSVHIIIRHFLFNANVFSTTGRAKYNTYFHTLTFIGTRAENPILYFVMVLLHIILLWISAEEIA